MNYLPFSSLGSDSGAQEQEAPDIDVDVLEEEQENEDEKSPWRVILFDDEIHTFEEVIGQLIKALSCTQERAEELTYKVHNEGKAEVFKGPFEDCFEVNGVLKEIQLITEIKG